MKPPKEKIIAALNGDTSTRKNDSLAVSILTAARGFALAVATERNIRRILITAGAFVALSVIFDVGYFEILIILFSWTLVIVCEIFNTALEKSLDYASGKEYHPLVKQGKDFAAASVFVASSFAWLLTLFVLLDKR